MKTLKEVLTAAYNRMSFGSAQLATPTDRNLEKKKSIFQSINSALTGKKKRKENPIPCSLAPIRCGEYRVVLHSHGYGQKLLS